MKGETFIITIVSSSLTTLPLHSPTPMTAQMSCLFSTPDLSSPLLPHRCASQYQILCCKILPYIHTTPPLLICSSPFSLPPPLNGLTLCLGAVEERRGERQKEKEGEQQASGSKGECTWMGRLPGHAVRGFCPACQQTLSFIGAHISSF